MTNPEGWTTEKQARYEAFMRAEKEAEIAEANRLEMERTTNDLAIDVAVPEAEAPPPDPWTAILAGVETAPAVTGAVNRTATHVNVSTAHLLKLVGVRNTQDKAYQENLSRLSGLMQDLGWTKPSNVWIGHTALKGFRKAVD